MKYERLQESRKRFIEDLSDALQVCHDNNLYPEAFESHCRAPGYEWLTTMQDDLSDLTDSQLRIISDDCIKSLDDFTWRMHDNDSNWLYKSGCGMISPTSALACLKHTKLNYYFFLDRQNNG